MGQLKTFNGQIYGAQNIAKPIWAAVELHKDIEKAQTIISNLTPEQKATVLKWFRVYTKHTHIIELIERTPAKKGADPKNLPAQAL